MVLCSLAAIVVLLRRVKRSDDARLRLFQDIETLTALSAAGEEQAIYWSAESRDEAVTPGLEALIGGAPESGGWFAFITGQLGGEDAAGLEASVSGLRRDGAAFTRQYMTSDGARCLQFRGAMAPGKTAVLFIRDRTASAGSLARVSADAHRLHNLLDVLPLPVWIQDGDGRIVYANNAYRAALEVGETAPFDEMPPLIPGQRPGALDDSRARTVRDHVVLRGERRLMEVSESPIEGGDVAGFAFDHTELENIQSELSRLAAGQEVILQSLGTAIALYGPDHSLQFFNNAYMQLWGLEEAWLRTNPPMGEVLEELRDKRRLPERADFPAFKQAQLDRFTSLIEPSEEMQHLPDGKTLRAVAIPHPFGGLLLLWEDVTDTLALERNYNTLIAVQRETLDNLFEGVAVIGANGRLRLSNPEFGRMWRIPAAELDIEPHISGIVDRMLEMIPTDGDPAEQRNRMIGDLTRREVHNGRIVRTDDTVLDFATIPLPDGAVLLSYLDVTASLRAESALRERNEALENADQLKTEFINNVSYELRTPLNTITGFTEILAKKYFGDLNPRQMEYVDGTLEAARLLLLLINDILDLATIEAGRMTLELERADLRELAESVLGLVGERARQKFIKVDLDCPPDIGEIEADSRRLKQALYNILSNAIKFTPQRGSISLAGQRDGDRIIMSVEDSGIGISEGDREWVFGMFERGGAPEARQAGMGIGLSLVKTFVELHGGTVSIEDGVGSGAKVVCALPASRAGQ